MNSNKDVKYRDCLDANEHRMQCKMDCVWMDVFSPIFVQEFNLKAFILCFLKGDLGMVGFMVETVAYNIISLV